MKYYVQKDGEKPEKIEGLGLVAKVTGLGKWGLIKNFTRQKKMKVTKKEWTIWRDKVNESKTI